MNPTDTIPLFFLLLTMIFLDCGLLWGIYPLVCCTKPNDLTFPVNCVKFLHLDTV